MNRLPWRLRTLGLTGIYDYGPAIECIVIIIMALTM